MIVYHVDKFGLLEPGEKLAKPSESVLPRLDVNTDLCRINSFFDSKLQMFAFQTLHQADCGDRAWALTEATLEYVRSLKFPKLPSRLAVLYASRTIEEAEQWHRAMLPSNPAACIVSLYTGRKVYSANRALRDDLYRIIANSLVDENCLLKVRCLAAVLPVAQRYWQSIVSAPRVLSSGNMGHEELLLVPPVRVSHRVYP